MEGNYSSWQIDYKEFYTLGSAEDKLKFLLRYAILAPSSHNSQPWRFRIRENKIFIFAEDARALPKSDKNRRQLYISLGAALENLLTAAAFYGYKTRVEYFPVGTEAAALVKFDEGRTDNRGDERIITAISSRHTNRNRYSNQPLTDAFINFVKSFTDNNFRVYLVSDRKLKDRIADVVSDALIEAMDDRDFRSELSEYIKSNITKEKVGMPMFGFGMPTIPSLVAPYILNRFNVNRLSRRQDEALLKEHTPYFVIISSRADNEESWMGAGRIFEAIALAGEREGIRTAPMAAAIQIGDHYKRLMNIFRTDLRPQVFFRMGYADSVSRHSPRFSIEDLLEK